MPKQKLHIIFDLDGTLSDTERKVSEADAVMATEQGWPTTTDEVFLELSGLGGREKMEIIAQKHGAAPAPEQLDALNEHHEKENYDLHFKPDLQPIDGVPQMLAALEKEGHALSIGSNTPTPASTATLKTLGLTRYFNSRVFGPDNSAGGRKKPAPDVYLQAMKGVDAPAVVVDDSPSGAAAGHAAGAFVIGRLDPAFGTGAEAARRTAEFRKAGADIVIRDYKTDLAPALTQAIKHIQAQAAQNQKPRAA